MVESDGIGLNPNVKCLIVKGEAMDAIRLHWFWSANPQKIRFALNEMGLPYRLEFVDLRVGAQRAESFLQLNPRGKVPALEVGDVVLWESGAALTYLAQREGKLWPCDEGLKGQALNLLFMESAAFQDVAGVFYYQKYIRPRFFGKPPDQTLIDANREKCDRLLGVLDGFLGDREWLLGELTVVDIAYAPWLAYLDLAQWPRLVAWAERLSNRDAWKACLKRVDF